MENNVRVQVKCDGIISQSSCHPDDKFDLCKGITLATRRLIVKLMRKEVEEYAKRI